MPCTKSLIWLYAFYIIAALAQLQSITPGTPMIVLSNSILDSTTTSLATTAEHFSTPIDNAVSASSPQSVETNPAPDPTISPESTQSVSVTKSSGTRTGSRSTRKGSRTTTKTFATTVTGMRTGSLSTQAVVTSEPPRNSTHPTEHTGSSGLTTIEKVGVGVGVVIGAAIIAALVAMSLVAYRRRKADSSTGLPFARFGASPAMSSSGPVSMSAAASAHSCSASVYSRSETHLASSVTAATTQERRDTVVSLDFRASQSTMPAQTPSTPSTPQLERAMSLDRWLPSPLSSRGSVAVAASSPVSPVVNRVVWPTNDHTI